MLLNTNNSRQLWGLCSKVLERKEVERGKTWEKSLLKWFCLIREFSSLFYILYFTLTLRRRKSHWVVYVWVYNSVASESSLPQFQSHSLLSAIILSKLLIFLICEMGKLMKPSYQVVVRMKLPNVKYWFIFNRDHLCYLWEIGHMKPDRKQDNI